VVTDLPEQLIAQAEFLVRNTTPNEANLRRAVSSAYYALFHLLVRDAIANWKHADHHSRLARMFDHKRMKDASTVALKEIGKAAESEQAAHLKLSIVAQSFVDLQLKALDAALSDAQARLAFLTWAEIKDEPHAQGYLYSLLFKDRS